MSEQYSPPKYRSLSNIFLFSLVIIFSLFAFTTTLFGINIYKEVTDSADQSYTIRASLFYVVNKIRSADQEGSVAVEERDGISVLVLKENYGEDAYETLIYHYDGAIREMLSRAGSKADLSLGDEVIIVNEFTVKKIEDMVYFSITSYDGNIYEMHVAMRSQQ